MMSHCLIRLCVHTSHHDIQVQPYANRFGTACEIDPKSIVNFGEEVVRGHPAFVLSRVIQVGGAVGREEGDILTHNKRIMRLILKGFITLVLAFFCHASSIYPILHTHSPHTTSTPNPLIMYRPWSLRSGRRPASRAGRSSATRKRPSGPSRSSPPSPMCR